MMVLASEEEEDEDGGETETNISRLRDTAEEAAPPYPVSLAVSKATSRSRQSPRKDWSWSRGK